MPRNKEQKAIYDKAYREKNKEKISQYKKEYREKHKEEIKQRDREYYHLNKEEINKKQIEYSQTESGKKSRKIADWKRQGMILPEGETWDSIYRKYLESTNCEQCNKVFKNSKDRHLDHCHTSGFIRNIVCCRCNQLRAVEDAKNLILE